MMNRKFYSKLYKWSKKKYREKHLDIHYNDIKCPNCKEWFSISGIENKHSYLHPQPDFGSHVKCGQCGHDSYWNLVAFPFPVSCDENGMPFKGD